MINGIIHGTRII